MRGRALLATTFLLAGCGSGEANDGGVIVSTNEPFLNAAISGRTIKLSSPGNKDIFFTVSDMEPTDDGQRWVGHHGRQQIMVETGAKSCVDSMSGASFPMSATITLGSDRTSGCARPAAMPHPGAGA